jgi:hypothetical protein
MLDFSTFLCPSAPFLAAKRNVSVFQREFVLIQIRDRETSQIHSELILQTHATFKKITFHTFLFHIYTLLVTQKCPEKVA